MLNAFSILSGTENKRIVFLKSGFECVESRAACCVSLTVASPKECWETVSFLISQLLFERDLNKIAFPTKTDGVSTVVIVYLSWVPQAATSYHLSQRLAEEGKFDLSQGVTVVGTHPGQDVLWLV